MFTLGNIHPKYRSSLRVINLLIAATIPVVEKHGLDEILKPFLCDLKTLADVGINVMINGVEQNFCGAVFMCLGDNLGINALAESFSFALRFCRTCYVTNSTFKAVSDSSSLELRSNNKHRVECDLVEGPLSKHYSKTYGINRRSALMDIPYFSMFNGGLPHDIMHDVFEGVALSLLFNHCIVSEKFLSLDNYNHRLAHFDYGYTANLPQ